MSIVEAFSVGLPVVATAVGGVPEAVGVSRTSAANQSPVAWIGGSPTSLLSSIPGASAGDGNAANAINANGDIVGQTLVGGSTSAFYLPHGGSGTILPTLGGATSAAGISNSGLVVGYSVNGACPNAFVWSAGTGMVPATPASVCVRDQRFDA